MADSKLAKLLADKKIDPRRVLVASHELETLTRDDRAIKLAKRRGKGGAAEEGAAKETRKPRSGRPVTQRAIDAAMKGGKLSGPTKARILRAVNHVLVQKKHAPVDLRALF